MCAIVHGNGLAFVAKVDLVKRRDTVAPCFRIAGDAKRGQQCCTHSFFAS